MPNISGVQGNLNLIKTSYKKTLSMGEGAASCDFQMIIEGYPDLTFLVQTANIPPFGREPIESFGPHGVQFDQQGRYRNKAEIPVGFKEVISGRSYSALRDWVANKKYLTVTLKLLGESAPSGAAPVTFKLEDCWIEIENADLSVEDATLVKPNGNLHANWIEPGSGGLAGAVAGAIQGALANL